MAKKKLDQFRLEPINTSTKTKRSWAYEDERGINIYNDSTDGGCGPVGMLRWPAIVAAAKRYAAYKRSRAKRKNA